MRYRNHYFCDRCQCEWQYETDFKDNRHCPECNRDNEPVRSVDLHSNVRVYTYDEVADRIKKHVDECDSEKLANLLLACFGCVDAVQDNEPEETVTVTFLNGLVEDW